MAKRAKLYIRLFISLVIIAIIWIVYFKYSESSKNYPENNGSSNKLYDDDLNELLKSTDYTAKSADMIYEFYLYESKMFDLVGENIISDKLHNPLKIAADLEVIIDREEELLKNFKKVHPPSDHAVKHQISCESYETKIDNVKSLATALRLKDQRLLDEALAKIKKACR